MSPANQRDHSHLPEQSEIERCMQEAIIEAQNGMEEGGVPIGSVLVRNGKIIGRGHNRRIQFGDPTAHGEIDCLRAAGRQKTYKDTVIYSTLMPCAMCAGSVYWTGVGHVVHGMSEKALKDLIGPDPENLTMDLPCSTVFAAGQRVVTVEGPLLAEESARVREGFWTGDA